MNPLICVISPLISVSCEILPEQVVGEESWKASARSLIFLSFFLRLIIIDTSDNRDWDILRANDL
jgi:hypothetical protein